MKKENEENPKFAPLFDIGYCKTDYIDFEHLSIEATRKEEGLEQIIDDPDNDIMYNPYKIQKNQKYNPIYSLFFDLSQEEFHTISFNQKYEMIDINKVVNKENREESKTTFIKFYPLLDPIRFMIGKYLIRPPSDEGSVHEDIILPSFTSRLEGISNNHSTKIREKLENIHNESYVDSFFCYLSSQLLNTHQFVHGIDFYGSYLGIQEKFKTDITDDVEYLYNSSFFKEHLHKLFEVSKNIHHHEGSNSCKNKKKNIY